MKKLLFLLVLLFVSGSLFAQTATVPALGDGSLGNPYQIASLDNLYWIASDTNRWGEHYIQTVDIDASATASWPGGEGWTPIGYLVGLPSPDNRPFKGSYNGQNYKISGLFMDYPADSSIALFGMTGGATLANIVLEDVDITGSTAVGALAGWHMTSTIINCSSSGTVSGEEYNGGLVGLCGFSATIKNSYSSCTVNGSNDRTGGLVGMIYTDCSIDSCYSSGDVAGAEYSGGISGFSFESEINFSFSLGDVSGTGHVGGLLGDNDDNTLVSNCYSIGNVIGTTSDIGGLIGYNGASADVEYSYSAGHVTGNLTTGGFIGTNDGDGSNITACFWDTETSTQASSDGGTGKTSSQMRTESTYTDASWDFTTAWDINSRNNAAYPFLLWQTFPPEPEVKTLPVSGITTTSANGNGYITSLGTSDPSQHGLCWNTTGDPDINDDKTSEGEATTVGVFSSTMTGLDPNTTYYVRAYATNLSGTSYGDQVSFSTLTQAQITFSDGSAFEPSFTLGQQDQAIGRFSLLSDVNNQAELNSVSVIVNGTRSGLSNFYIWYDMENSFDNVTATQIGTVIASDPGDGASLNFSGLSLTINDKTIYFFVTCDMASDADGSIQGVITNNDALGFSDAALTGTISNALLSSSDIPLPITLASFTATAVNGTVELAWETATETNNANFVIYRNDEAIASVAGAGTTSEPHNYSYVDDAVVPGVTYTYVLADVSYANEETKYEDDAVTVTVSNDLVEADFVVGAAYPNPFNPTAVVPLELSKDAMVKASVYDLVGREVKTLVNGNVSAGSHELKINGENMTTGIYLVKVVVDNVIDVQKIALMK